MALVSSLVETPWHETRWLYRQRFKIETFHRNAKQRFGLGDFHCRSLERIENHMALPYLRYLVGTLMKVVYPELGGLGWMAVREKVFQDPRVLAGTRQRTVGTAAKTLLLRRPPARSRNCKTVVDWGSTGILLICPDNFARFLSLSRGLSRP